ncbi:MAG TPA: hypothetical protein VII78_14710 [Myxococcota bacterium]|jgi:hypothetical protein
MSGFVLLARAAEGAGWIGSWSPGIGDPTPAGWLATVAYFAAAGCCWAAARRIKPEYRRAPSLRREWRLWGTLSALLALLGVNKQLDLQSALTEIARGLARSGGWYEQRRGLQLAFVAVVALVALLAAVASLWATRRTSPPVRVAVVGFGALLAFVVARAASFHHVDMAISHEWLGLRVSSLVELAGLAVLIVAARWQRRALGS